jgi:hypothetical protein
LEVLDLRYLYALVGLAVLLSAASAAAGNFKVQLDVATYVDAANANASFSENDTFWAASVEGKPVKEAYLSFVNNFGTVGVFNPDKVSSATLKLIAKNVDKPGMIKAYFVHGATMETATWKDKPEYNTNVSASLDVQKMDEYTMDVTPLIKEAVKTCTEGCPYSLVLVADDNATIGFSKDTQKPSLDYTTAD